MPLQTKATFSHLGKRKKSPHTPREERIHTFKISDVSILGASLILFGREGGELRTMVDPAGERK